MKVAIIGAGICGLYLGWKLSEKGYQVTVFEKKSEIGKKVCSGLFSERILDFIPQSQKLIQNQITSVLIHFPKKTLKIEFSKKFLVMNHFELDNLVADLAKKAGAKIILNYNTARNDLDVFLDVFKEEFDRIIGCDGPNSFVRESLGFPDPNFRLAIQGFTPAPLLEKSGGGFIETWPIKSGFIWKIPRRGETEYGIIEAPETAKPLFEKFLKTKNLNLERTSSAIIPQGLVIPSNSKITICGDAMGLTKPWSGGGVIWGLTAADFLLKNFPDFVKYQKETKKFFLPKIIFSKIAVKMVYFLGFNFPWLLPKNVKIEGDFLI